MRINSYRTITFLVVVLGTTGCNALDGVGQTLIPYIGILIILMFFFIILIAIAKVGLSEPPTNKSAEPKLYPENTKVVPLYQILIKNILGRISYVSKIIYNAPRIIYQSFKSKGKPKSTVFNNDNERLNRNPEKPTSKEKKTEKSEELGKEKLTTFKLDLKPKEIGSENQDVLDRVIQEGAEINQRLENKKKANLQLKEELVKVEREGTEINHRLENKRKANLQLKEELVKVEREGTEINHRLKNQKEVNIHLNEELVKAEVENRCLFHDRQKIDVEKQNISDLTKTNNAERIFRRQLPEEGTNKTSVGETKAEDSFGLQSQNEVFAEFPNGKSFFTIHNKEQPQVSFFRLFDIENGTNGKFELVKNEQSLRQVFSLVDSLKDVAMLDGVGIPEVTSFFTTPGEIIKSNEGYWTVSKPMTLKWPA